MKEAWKPAAPKKYVTHAELPIIIRQELLAIAERVLFPQRFVPNALERELDKIPAKEHLPQILAARAKAPAKGNGKGKWSRPPVIPGKAHDHKQRCGKECSARRA